MTSLKPIIKKTIKTYSLIIFLLYVLRYIIGFKDAILHASRGNNNNDFGGDDFSLDPVDSLSFDEGCEQNNTKAEQQIQNQKNQNQHCNKKKVDSIVTNSEMFYGTTDVAGGKEKQMKSLHQNISMETEISTTPGAGGEREKVEVDVDLVDSETNATMATLDPLAEATSCSSYNTSSSTSSFSPPSKYKDSSCAEDQHYEHDASTTADISAIASALDVTCATTTAITGAMHQEQHLHGGGGGDTDNNTEGEEDYGTIAIAPDAPQSFL